MGSEIDNATNKDRFANIQVGFTCSTAATANKTLEIYILYAIDGTNYEDGGTSVDPVIVPVGVVAARGTVTTAQTVTLKGIELQPFKFKILVKSELDQTAATTVLVYTGVQASA